MHRRLLPIAGPLLGIVILLAACAPQEAAEPVATDHVDLPPSYKFEPAAITVPDGTTVTWTNNDSAQHTVTQDPAGSGFASGALTPGSTFENTFDTAGTFEYFCEIHPSMTGTVVVS